MYASPLSEIPIMVPIDKQEQEKIGSFLSAIDRLVEKEESAIERYESLKKGYLQKIFAD
jgi:restriction endonuclease S subunit